MTTRHNTKNNECSDDYQKQKFGHDSKCLRICSFILLPTVIYNIKSMLFIYEYHLGYNWFLQLLAFSSRNCFQTMLLHSKICLAFIQRLWKIANNLCLELISMFLEEIILMTSSPHQWISKSIHFSYFRKFSYKFANFSIQMFINKYWASCSSNLFT